MLCRTKLITFCNNVCIATFFVLMTAIASHSEESGKSLKEKLQEKRISIIAPVEGCDNEIKKHCKNSNDDTRDILSCLADYEDSLSSKCKDGALKAASLIVEGGANLDKAIIACQADIDALCMDIQLGERRTISCLKANEDAVDEQCINTLKETGFWDEKNRGIWKLSE